LVRSVIAYSRMDDQTIDGKIDSNNSEWTVNTSELWLFGRVHVWTEVVSDSGCGDCPFLRNNYFSHSKVLPT